MAGGIEEVDVRVGDEIVTVRVPEGMSDDEIKRRVQSQSQAITQQESSPYSQTGVSGYLTRPEEMPRREPSAIGEAIRKSLLPVGIGLAATAAAPAVGIPALVAGIAGGILGEGTNQRLGITEPSGAQLALSGASDPAFRGLGAAYQGGRRLLSRILPGAGASLPTHAL